MSPAPASRREWGVVIGLAIALFPFSVLLYNHLGEDAFITFRYVRNFAAGHGLTFNAGEHVEGYSNLLWALLLVPFEWAGIRLHVAARLLTTAFLAGLIVLSWWAGWRLLAERQQPWLAWWLPVALFVEPFLRYHSDRGLETVAYAALLAAMTLLIGGGGPLLAAGVCGGLAAITRPEGIGFVLAAAPAAWLAADAQRWRRAALFLLPALVLFAAQLAFRKLTYGEWVPNTMIAKRGSPPGAWREVAGLFCSHAFVPLLGLAGCLMALRVPRLRVLAAAALLQWLAAVAFQLKAGGLLAAGFRYLAPILVPSLIGCWLLLLTLMEQKRPRRQGGFMAPLAAAALLLLVAWTPFVEGSRLFRGNGDAPRSRLLARLVERPTWNLGDRFTWYFKDPIFLNASAGRWLRENLPADAVFALDQMGQVGYFAGERQTIIDLLGLMDRHIARHGVSVEYLLERDVQYVVVESASDDAVWPRDWRHQPHVPFLREFAAGEDFRAHFEQRWVLHSPGDFLKLNYVVWARRGDSPAAREFIPIGPDRDEFERWWRVF